MWAASCSIQHPEVWHKDITSPGPTLSDTSHILNIQQFQKILGNNHSNYRSVDDISDSNENKQLVGHVWNLLTSHQHQSEFIHHLLDALILLMLFDHLCYIYFFKINFYVWVHAVDTCAHIYVRLKDNLGCYSSGEVHFKKCVYVVVCMYREYEPHLICGKTSPTFSETESLCCIMSYYLNQAFLGIHLSLGIWTQLQELAWQTLIYWDISPGFLSSDSLLPSDLIFHHSSQQPLLYSQDLPPSSEVPGSLAHTTSPSCNQLPQSLALSLFLFRTSVQMSLS